MYMVSAVYIIFNIKSGNYYIGSSVNIHVRKNTHFSTLKHNKHHNKILQRAYNRHGKQSLIFSILKICNKKDTLFWEQHYLDKYKPKYNIAKSSTAPTLGLKQSDEWKAKYKGRTSWLKGKKWTDEQRQIFMENRKYLPHKEATKLKIKQSCSKNYNIIAATNANKKQVKDSLGNIFNSITECAKFHNLTHTSVSKILSGKSRKTRKGITFEYF